MCVVSVHFLYVFFSLKTDVFVLRVFGELLSHLLHQSGCPIHWQISVPSWATAEITIFTHFFGMETVEVLETYSIHKGE